MKTQWIGLVLVAAGLASCASSHNGILLSKTSNTAGTAVFEPNGNIRLNLKGKVYDGQWAFTPAGGFSGSGFAPGLGFGGFNFGRDSGPGSVIAVSADGASLRCMYMYNNRTEGGAGECRDDSGEVFDFQIH